MKRPGPPRRTGSNGAPPGGPDAQIAAARNALVAAEAEVERVSRDRLTDLLGQSVQQRFRHFDDPNLVAADRVRLRASVLDPHEARGSLWASMASMAERVAFRLVGRPRTIVAMMVFCIGVPAALHAMTLHDADRATVIRLTHVKTKNWDGKTITGVWGPGVSIVVFGEGPMLQARVWNAGAGYTIYDINAHDVAVDRRSPWQAVTAFAVAVHAGWSQPAAPS